MVARKDEKDFIRISQVIGKGKVVGSLSGWQAILLLVVLLLICVLYSLKIGLLKSILLGTWLLGSTILVVRNRPDRVIRRLLGKPKRWRRGFHSASPLFGKVDRK